MSASLRAFVSKALELNRISFGDLRRLQRNVFPHGLATREQAEVLIALDHTIARTDKAWAGYLVAALTEFVVWRSSSPGRVEPETAAWLVASLSCGRPTRTTGMIARAIVQEAQHCEEPLIGFALTSPKRPSAQPEPMTGRGEQALPASLALKPSQLSAQAVPRQGLGEPFGDLLPPTGLLHGRSILRTAPPIELRLRA
jgi:hypothetical protein